MEKTLNSINHIERFVERKAGSKIITVYVDESIQFEVDISDPTGDLTCGWLLSEVTRKYTLILEAIQR